MITCRIRPFTLIKKQETEALCSEIAPKLMPGINRLNGCPKRLCATMRGNEKEEFLKVFPEIVSSIVQRNDSFRNVSGVGSFIKENDFVDCFGDETVARKAGTDIQEGKCTWLAVTALQRCSTAQRAQFSACYGGAGAARVRRVKRLYERLELPVLYRHAERAAYEDIVKRIKALKSNNVIPPAVLLKLLDMMYYMRSKPENSMVSKNV